MTMFNPYTWTQQMLEPHFPPGQVLKDVTAQKLPERFIQHHVMYGSDDLSAAERGLRQIKYNIRLRVYAENSATAYEMSMKALGYLEQAVHEQREVDGARAIAFDVGQVPIENFKVTAVKTVHGAQFDCTFAVQFLLTPQQTFGDTVKW